MLYYTFTPVNIIKSIMKRIKLIFAASIITILIPFAVAAGQDMKNEQRIKIMIAEDDGSKVILDTLITGKSVSDSIVLKDGHTIYLAKEDVMVHPELRFPQNILSLPLPRQEMMTGDRSTRR